MYLFLTDTLQARWSWIGYTFDESLGWVWDDGSASQGYGNWENPSDGTNPPQDKPCAAVSKYHIKILYF